MPTSSPLLRRRAAKTRPTLQFLCHFRLDRLVERGLSLVRGAQHGTGAGETARPERLAFTEPARERGFGPVSGGQFSVARASRLRLEDVSSRLYRLQATFIA
jgi:hypothetical protein